MKGCYQFAGLNFQLISKYERVHEYCAEYRTEQDPDILIELTDEDLGREHQHRAKWLGERIAEDPYSDDASVEIAAFHRKVCDQLPYHDSFMFHGSAVSVDHETYIFTALSGTGKSTHTALWRQLLGERAVMVNDDKPMIHVGPDGRAIVYGTPWNGKHHIGNRIAVPLKAICLLERSENNWIQETDLREIFPKLTRQIYRTNDPAALSRIVSCIYRMNVKYYKLGCNMDIEAARLSYNTMSQ